MRARRPAWLMAIALTGCSALFEFDSGPADKGGIAGLWRLDDGAGSVARDSSRSPHDGLIVGEATWTDGGLRLSGAGYVSVDGVSVTNGDAFTIVAWFRTSSTEDSDVLYSEGSSDGSAMCYVAVNENVANDLEFGVIDDQPTWGVISYEDGATADGAWHLVAGVQRSKSDRFLWLDGAVVGVNPTPVGILTVNQASIGRLAGNRDMNYFVGEIDEVRVYQRALATTELAELHPSAN